MTVADLLDEIYLIVKDDAFFADDAAKEVMLRRVNTALLTACSYPGVEVPSLKRLGRAITSPTEAFVGIEGVSDVFAGKVLAVGEPGKVKIYTRLEDFYTDYYPLDKSGDVTAVCVAGNILWYQGIPETPVSLLVVLQNDPPVLTSEDDVIPVVPEAFQLQILAHGVAAHLYDTIEDGVDGAKVNTQNSQMQFLTGMQRWMEFLGQRKQHIKTSHW